MKYLAKNNIYLKEHSINVKDIMFKLSDITIKDNKDNKYNIIIEHSSLLHDIGKITKEFQNLLKNKLKKVNIKYQHNIISWAFLSKYYKLDNNELKNQVLYLVFWHHGLYIDKNLNDITDTSVLYDIDEEDINNMKSYLIDTVGKEYLNEYIDETDINNPPSYYYKDKKLHKLRFLYSLLVSSDRIVSSGDLNLENYLNLKNNYNPIKNWIYKNSERSKKQIEIINKTKGTVMLNAPAGYGKTIMGLLWGLKRNKKILWVCPRNNVAYGIYDSILKEIKNMNINPTVELILGGEVIKGNNKNMFDSDIIITNIDNFLAPSNNNSLLKYFSLINLSSVIFDEYHELITDSALFSAFINIMKIRHNLTKSETLLLSATPNHINFLWENAFSNKTLIMPDNNKHFLAQHTEKFKLNIKEDVFIDNINNNSLVIYNSIKNSQIEYNQNNYSILYHSKFNDKIKIKKLDFLLKNFNKNNNINKNVIGTHILQASLDISFKNLYESILSPDSTLQRIGRCNRWGEYKKSTLNILFINDKSENFISNMLYDKDLKKKWFKFLYKYDNKELTLDNLYNIYNNFYKKYEKDIKQLILKIYQKSFNNLKKIYPLKFYKKNDNNIMTSGSNKLRTKGNEIFYIVKNSENDKWENMFSDEIYFSFDKQFKENNNTINNIKKIHKKLRNNEQFDFDKLVKISKYNTITIDEIRRKAKKSNTPYIIFNKVYDKKLGLIDINLYNEIKN